MSRLRIAISGSSGMVGSYLTDFFLQAGHEVTRLVRQPHSSTAQKNSILWNIEEGTMETKKLEGYDVLMHLAGASIAAKRWTKEYKEEILKSRVKGTALLCDAFKKLKYPPKVFLCASAAGYYGNRPGQAVDESSSAGSGFLAHVCEELEKTAMRAKEAGVRVVCLRFGMVLSPVGGALAKMLPIFRLGLGGPLGSGKQMMSWVALEEIPAVVLHLIQEEKLSGALNIVSPQAVSNLEFTKILGRVLKRPTVFLLPFLGVKILFGEMGEELLLNGAQVIPRRLQESGYKFRYPYLQKTLEEIL